MWSAVCSYCFLYCLGLFCSSYCHFSSFDEVFWPWTTSCVHLQIKRNIRSLSFWLLLYTHNHFNLSVSGCMDSWKAPQWFFCVAVGVNKLSIFNKKTWLTLHLLFIASRPLRVVMNRYTVNILHLIRCHTHTGKGAFYVHGRVVVSKMYFIFSTPRGYRLLAGDCHCHSCTVHTSVVTQVHMGGLCVIKV